MREWKMRERGKCKGGKSGVDQSAAEYTNCMAGKCETRKYGQPKSY